MGRFYGNFQVPHKNLGSCACAKQCVPGAPSDFSITWEQGYIEVSNAVIKMYDFLFTENDLI